MEVPDLIKEYLDTHDFLDIPELGTLFLTREPFRFGNENNQLKPGVRNLIFRENRNVFDESLAKFIAEKNDVTILEAEHQITDFISPLKSLVPNRSSHEVPGLGKFDGYDGINLSFTMGKDGFVPSEFGLEAIDLEPISAFQPSFVEALTHSDPAHFSTSMDNPWEYPEEATNETSSHFEDTHVPVEPVGYQYPPFANENQPSYESQPSHEMYVSETEHAITSASPGYTEPPASMDAPYQAEATNNKEAPSYVEAPLYIADPAASLPETPDSESNYDTESGTNRALWWVLGVAIVLLVAGGSLFYFKDQLFSRNKLFPKDTVRAITKDSIKTNTVDSGALVASTKDTALNQSKDATSTHTVTTEKNDTPVTAKSPDLPSHEIVIRPIDEAPKFLLVKKCHLLGSARGNVVTYKGKGIDCFIAKNDKDPLWTYLVVFGGYESKQDAQSNLSSIRKSTKADVEMVINTQGK